MNDTNKKDYVVFYDVLTIIAAFMVVVFHCNMTFYDYSNTISWKISVVVRCIVYSAVPIFFMLSGAKLLNYREKYTTKQFIKKRIAKIGIPFLFWNVFYIIYDYLTTQKFEFSSPREFISMFFNSEFQSRYWFFWPLFAIYLAMPILSLLLKFENSRKYLWYMVGMAFGISWVLKPILLIFGIKYNGYFSFPVAENFVAYVLFGYLISTEEWNFKKRLSLYLAALLSGIFAVIFTIAISAKNGETSRFIVDYFYFPSGLTGAAIFVFIKHKKLSFITKNEKLKKLTRKVSECCMGVWLSHTLVMSVLSYLTRLEEQSYIWRFGIPFVVFVICIIGVYIAKKIPFIKKLA